MSSDKLRYHEHVCRALRSILVLVNAKNLPSVETIITLIIILQPIIYATNILPITDFATDWVFKVAKPRSPILMEPVAPVMKILSHLRSL